MNRFPVFEKVEHSAVVEEAFVVVFLAEACYHGLVEAVVFSALFGYFWLGVEREQKDERKVYREVV